MDAARRFSFALTCLLATSLQAADTRGLFNFDNEGDLAFLKTNDARATRVPSGDGQALRIETGHRESWPGVTLTAPGQAWDLNAFATVTLSARNLGSNSLTLFCRVDNAGADGTKHCVSGSTSLAPGARGTLRVDLTRQTDDTLGGQLFGMRGYPKKRDGDHTIDPIRVTQLLVFVHKPERDHVFEIDDIRTAGNFTPPTAFVTDADPYFPLIDTFGQYRHREWPGKIQSLDDLKRRAGQEALELAAKQAPPDWNVWGGLRQGPVLKATGFFRTEKHAGKWWLVDPEGRLFWSHGVDCVRMTELTAVTGREAWFENYPGGQPEFSPCVQPNLHVIKGHFVGKPASGFSFGSANLIRKHGTNWRDLASLNAHRRLRSWGLNTIGNWSDQNLRRMRSTPYVDTIGSYGARSIEGSEGYWGKFPDPFDPSFREAFRKSMQGKRGQSAGDPWCIGFFSDNEIAWGDDTSLALAALQSPSNQPAKIAFVTRLRSTHTSIGSLNQSWGTTNATWDALLASRTPPDLSRARKDLEAFYTEIATAYFTIARDTIKELAPNQLYLGCRFAWVNARAAAVAAKFCDVVSYNLYQRSVADFRFNGGADVPLMIGEFHFGALDRGMFHTGLVPTASQNERATAYGQYVLGAVRHPQFVGCHWFQYQDQPTTGRSLDEENYQIGLVDITDTPYPETIAAVRAVGHQLYRERLKP